MPKSPPLSGTVGPFPMPKTAPTPAVGEDVTAASIQAAVKPLLDQDATLENAILTILKDPVDLPDANVTLDSATGGNYIRFLTAPSGARIVKLRQSTTPIPVKGNWFYITALIGNSAFTYGIQREGSDDYVAVLGNGLSSSGNHVGCALVRFNGTVWQLLGVGGTKAFAGGDA